MTLTTHTTTSKPLMKLDFEKAHTTYLNAAGEEVPGVTTVLGILNKPALVYWAWNLGKKGQDYRKVSDKAATIGSVAHAMAEAYLKGMELDFSNIPNDVRDKAETSYIKFVSWWDSMNLEVVCCERALVSEDWQCGGTLDILARHRVDGRIYVIDLKTSKDIYREMRIQISAYADMVTHEDNIKVDECIIARIGKEESGDFEARQVFDRLECVRAFDAIAKAFHALKTVKQ